MNFPIFNKTQLKQFKSQMTYLYIFILVKLLILNPKYNNFYLRKCLFVTMIFGFSLRKNSDYHLYGMILES